jgi:hypothetical protein
MSRGTSLFTTPGEPLKAARPAAETLQLLTRFTDLDLLLNRWGRISDRQARWIRLSFYLKLAVVIVTGVLFILALVALVVSKPRSLNDAGWLLPGIPLAVFGVRCGITVMRLRRDLEERACIRIEGPLVKFTRQRSDEDGTWTVYCFSFGTGRESIEVEVESTAWDLIPVGGPYWVYVARNSRRLLSAECPTHWAAG